MDQRGWYQRSRPLFAAVVAPANEKAGKRLGDIHAALYASTFVPVLAATG
ncbi:hypothetical protein [Streptomyces sp. NPDC005181]